MITPTGSLCGRCRYLFWNDCLGANTSMCVALGGKDWAKPADYLVDGQVSSIPMVKQCTQYAPKLKEFHCLPKHMD